MDLTYGPYNGLRPTDNARGLVLTQVSYMTYIVTLYFINQSFNLGLFMHFNRTYGSFSSLGSDNTQFDFLTFQN